MEHRNFQLDTEWSMIHYPEKPTGFGILIIGDERHFVDEHTSFWMQNEGKMAIINKLKKAGYTIFYSNLYGKNWGNQKAVDLGKRLYQYVMRTEILNEKIHLFAEGMGALVALELMKTMESNIRSVVLINPILSLQNHLKQEKDHKFFYKKLLEEISFSYKKDRKDIEKELFEKTHETTLKTKIPVKMIQILSGNRAYRQSELYQKILKNDHSSISICLILPEKNEIIGKKIIDFFKSYEQVL
ncbi:hydrolase [Bacillus aquiflavi]|uniref:Hydrolase n=1 Tax=Bacillus aquiflavi TaxID=2672567 RepID=A0A6B3VZR4_9BACI|nr:hydrolase [Bacillus aquiflavi]MBA4536466.1 hydrolase [Bacillus aquiflavi]NEY80834.1 hydrolase [Bacillus aquiflavi]UAC49075.1 hydrolase [Bacillus aquiflavi]